MSLRSDSNATRLRNAHDVIQTHRAQKENAKRSIQLSDVLFSESRRRKRTRVLRSRRRHQIGRQTGGSLDQKRNCNAHESGGGRGGVEGTEQSRFKLETCQLYG